MMEDNDSLSDHGVGEARLGGGGRNKIRQYSKNHTLQYT